jgi:hypothetical protein
MFEKFNFGNHVNVMGVFLDTLSPKFDIAIKGGAWQLAQTA